MEDLNNLANHSSSVANNNHSSQLAQVKTLSELKATKKIIIIISDLKSQSSAIQELAKPLSLMQFLPLWEASLKMKRAVSCTSKPLFIQMMLISIRSCISTCQAKRDIISTFTSMSMAAPLSSIYLTSPNVQRSRGSSNGSPSAREHVKSQSKSWLETKSMSFKQLGQTRKVNQPKQLSKLQIQLRNQKLSTLRESMEWSTSKHAVLEKLVSFKFSIICSILFWL